MALYSDRGPGIGSGAIDRLSRRTLLGAVPAALLSPQLVSQDNAAGPALLQSLAASGAALSGVYPGHLQGVCTNDRDAIFWSMTTDIVKTDLSGNIVRQVSVISHHGDLCHVGGKIYVAVNLGLFNDPEMRSDSWIHVYDAGDLSLLARHAVGDVVYGAGGIAFGDGRFVVVGGLANGQDENRIYEYDETFASSRQIGLPTGQTYKGIQTAAFDGDHWWFGCYGQPDFTEVLIRTNRTFGAIEKYAFDASTGIVALDRDTFLVARSVCGKESCVARLAPVRLNGFVETGRLMPT